MLTDVNVAYEAVRAQNSAKAAIEDSNLNDVARRIYDTFGGSKMWATASIDQWWVAAVETYSEGFSGVAKKRLVKPTRDMVLNVMTRLPEDMTPHVDAGSFAL